MKACKRSLWLQFISLSEQFSIEFRKWKSKVKTKTNPSLITRVFPRFKEDARSYFKFSLVSVDVNFVLIDSCEYFGFGFSKVRFRVSWFFDDYSKTSLSKINCNSNIHSFWEKNEGTLESLIEYSIIYTHFSYFFVCLFFFLQGLINLKNYDDRLYVNVDDLAV